MRFDVVNRAIGVAWLAVTVLASACAAGAGESEEAAALALSIEESVRIAVANNPLVQVAREEKRVARGKVTEATSAAFPKLNISGSYTWLGELPSATFEGRTFTLGEQGQYLTSINLTQTLFRAGRTAAGIRAAKLYRTLADEQLSGMEQTIAFNAEKAYYDVLLEKEFYAVAQDTLELAESHRLDVEEKNALGLVSNYDLLRARIEVSNIHAQMIQARNALHLAETAFL